MLNITQEENRLANEKLFGGINSGDGPLEKWATDAITDFTRTRMREDGFFRRLIPLTPVGNDDLVRQVHTSKPTIVVDKEPDSPAAISVPFATMPVNLYIRGPRYPVMFDRILTPRFTKDVDELRTWIMDIRQVLSDNAIKDMLAEEDGKFIRAINAVLVGPGFTVPTSGTVQYEVIAGGITRDTLYDGLKVMPNTPSNLEVHSVLLNNITIKDVCKLTRNEMGGGMSEAVMRDGWTEENFQGVRYVITIKKGLVPTNTMYHFADPKFIGKSYILEDTTMYIRREAFMLEFFAYQTMGAAIGNSSGVARVDYQ